MYIVWILVIGLVVGTVARLFVPGRDFGGLLTTMLLGVAGSFAAAFLGRALGVYQGPWSGPGFVSSVVGAIFLLLVYRLFAGSLRRAPRRS